MDLLRSVLAPGRLCQSDLEQHPWSVRLLHYFNFLVLDSPLPNGRPMSKSFRDQTCDGLALLRASSSSSEAP